MYMSHSDRASALLPYLAAGLANGDRCCAFVGDPDISQVVGGLQGTSDPDAAMASGQLEIGTSDGTDFRARDSGVAQVVAFWRARIAASQTNGFARTRLTADAAWWALQLPGPDALIEYESELNRLVGGASDSVLCLYDLSLVSGSWVLDVIKVHPTVFFCGLEISNPYYVTPDEADELRRDRTHAQSPA
jgi:hypothetical protein